MGIVESEVELGLVVELGLESDKEERRCGVGGWSAKENGRGLDGDISSYSSSSSSSLFGRARRWIDCLDLFGKSAVSRLEVKVRKKY